MAHQHGLHRGRVAIVAGVLGALAAAGALAARGQSPPSRNDATAAIAVIVNRSNPVEQLTRDELRRIFMLVTQTWPHGRKITVVLGEKGDPLRAQAIRLLCGISEADYDRHVLLQTFRGSISWGPRSIRSAGAMIRFVFNAPGAIGYVPADQVDSSTKVLRIDGLLPGDPRYPLQGRVAPGDPAALE